MPLDEPGLFDRLSLDFLDSFTSLPSGGVLGDVARGDEDDDEGRSHASGGADMLLLRMPLNDFFRDIGGGRGVG